MSGNKKESSIIGQIVVAVAIALLAGGTAPWWWDEFFVRNKATTFPSSKLDTSYLNSYLKSKNFQQADEETWRLMRKSSGVEKLDVTALRSLPCEDLAAIDKLWVSSSDKKFGFSVQKSIWQSISGEFDYNSWLTFSDRVGWRVNGSWVQYNSFSFSVASLTGNLPTRAVGLLWNDWGLERDVALMNRLESCGIK